MKMDESLVSGVEKIKDYFNSPDESVTSNILSALKKDEEIIQNSPKKQQHNQAEEVPEVVESSQTSSQIVDTGRVKGWKERLELLRLEKEKQKSQQESILMSNGYEASLDKNETTHDRSLAHSTQMSDVSNLFAPAPGLQRGMNGKFNIDKDKVKDKRKPDFDKKQESSLTSDVNSKKNANLIKDAERSLKINNDSSKSAIGRSSLLGSGSKIPQKKQLNNKNAQSTPDKRRELAAKNNALQQKIGEKHDYNTKRQTSMASGSIPKPVNSRLGVGSSTVNRASNINSSRTVSTRYSHTRKSHIEKEIPDSTLSDEKSKPLSEKNTSDILGTSASRELKQIEQNKLTTNKLSAEIKQDDLQLQSEVYSSSQRTMGVDSDMTTIKKRDLQELRDELDNLKEQLQQVNKELTNNEQEKQKLIQAHQAELNKIKQETEAEIKERQDIIIQDHDKVAQDQVKSDEKLSLINSQQLSGSQNKERENDQIFAEMQEKLKKLEEQNSQLIAEKLKIEEDLKQKIDQMIQAHLDQQTKLKEENNTALEDLKAENIEKQKEIEQLKLQSDEVVQKFMLDSQQKDKLIEELQEKAKGLESNPKQADDIFIREEYKQLKSQCDEQFQQIEQLKQQAEGMMIDLEANQIEIDLLKDQKADLIDEMAQQTAAKVTAEDEADLLDQLSREDLKQQNYKLRVAITKLSDNFAKEREKLHQKIQDDSGKKKIIADYEQKLEDLDVLLDELNRKEDEINQLQNENEDCLEYEAMVEEMAHELLKHEEENKKCQNKIKQLYDLIRLHEEYTENLELYNEEIHEELAEKDAIISKLEYLRKEDEDLLLDTEDENEKYRSKVQQLSKTIRELTNQLQQTSETTEQKSQVQMLIEKQNHLIQQIKNQEKFTVENQLKQIDIHWKESLKTTVIQSSIPRGLIPTMQLQSMDKLIQLKLTSQKALYMLRYICEKQIPNVHNLYDIGGTVGQMDQDEIESATMNKLNFLKLMINLCVKVSFFIDYAQRIILCMSNMSIEQYKKVTDDDFAPVHFQQIKKIDEEVTHILEKLKNENIGLKYDLSGLDGHIRKVQDLKFLTQKVFLTKTKEELQAEQSDFGFGDQKILIDQQVRKRQQLVENCEKLDLRHQALMMTYQVIALQTFVGEILIKHSKKQNIEIVQWKKCQLIYGRLFDLIFKLDHISFSSAGDEFLNLKELTTEKKLKEKYEAIKEVWSNQDLKIDDILRKDWNSILDAIQKDLSHQFNDFKFKALLQYMDKAIIADKSSNHHETGIDQLFYYNQEMLQDEVPWMQISKNIAKEMEKNEELKTRLGDLNQKNIQLLKQKIEHENSMRILEQTKIGLEQRLTSSETKVEQLKSLKNDLDNSNKKCQQTEKQNTDLIKKLEHTQTKYKDLKKKNEELKKVAADGPFEKSNSKNQPSLKGQKQSAAQNFFQKYRSNKDGENIPNKSSLQINQQQSDEKFRLPNCLLTRTVTIHESHSSRQQSQRSQNNAALTEMMQTQEESFMAIIEKFQQDRLRLRGRDMTARLAALSKSSGAFNEITKLHVERESMNLRLSMEEEDQLVHAVNKVTALKQHAKLQMASIRIPNLQKKHDLQKDLNLKQQKNNEQTRNSIYKRLVSKENQSLLFDSSEAPAGGPSTHNPTTALSDVTRTNMNINWMLQEARDQVNGAMSTLMQQADLDQGSFVIRKMHKINEARDVSELQDDNHDNQPQIKQNASQIHIGSIQLGSFLNKKDRDTEIHSKPKTKNVVFSVKSLRGLQRNLGVLSV